MNNTKALLLNIVIFFITSSFCVAEAPNTDFKNSITNSGKLIITKDNAGTDKGKNSSFSIFKETYVPVEQYEIKARLNTRPKAIKPDGANLSEEEKLIVDSVFLDSRFAGENPNPHDAKILKFHKAMLNPQQLMNKAIYKQIINQNHSKDPKLDCIKVIGKDFESSLGYTFPIGP